MKIARKINSEKLNSIFESELIVKEYEIDFDKVKSIDDILVVLRAMKVTLRWFSEECPEQFKEIYEKGFLKE